LSLYIMGDYRKIFDDGDVQIDGPSVVLHGSGQAHANDLYGAGFEQVDIQFDPSWLRTCPVGAAERVRCWSGGPVAAAGAALAARWEDPASTEQDLAVATAGFLAFAFQSAPTRLPPWYSTVADRLRAEPGATARSIAADLGLSPVWMAHAYRLIAGEGIRRTVMRKRVERAVALLDEGNAGLADVAVAAGFCDQSHMNRAFQQLLRRTPAAVQRERAFAAAPPR
jgi:AraC family transcriptional regulator